MKARVLVLIALLGAPSVPVGAQSLFNSAGVGLPVEALDGRARALGSLGIGLPGAALAPNDPAAAARLLLPTGLIVAQPSWGDFGQDGTGERRYYRGTRFPMLGVGYPVVSGIATLYVTSFLDQGFQGERAVSVDIGGSPVSATDSFEQDGSVSTLNLGYSRMITGRTSVGLTVGRYAGSVVRRLVRDFDDSSSAGAVEPYQSGGAWSYSGQLATAGVASDLAGFVRVAASLTWSTAVDAEASSGTDGSDRSFDVPLQLRVGASAALAPGLTLSASAARADWSGTARDLGAGSDAGPATGFGVGVELSQVRLFRGSAPIRLGFRRSGLPFSFGSGGATERVLAGGVALNLNEDSGLVLASADLALERGRRSGGSLTEDFWRATVSLRVAGF